MKDRNLKLFYIHEAFFQFSDTMLIIVLPIFLYKLFGHVSAFFVFSFIWNLFYLSIFIPVFNTAMRWGRPKYFMATGALFYVISLILLGQTTPENIRMIIPATLFFMLYVSFYWMTRHWFFSVITDHQKIGKQMSYLTIIRIIIGFIAPIVGGWISFFVSFNVTFVLGAIAGFFSLIPILLFHAPPHPEQYNWKKIRQVLKKPEIRAIRPAYFWEGFSSYLINAAWILAFAIFISNIKDLGILVGVTTLIAVLLTRLSGYWFDKRKRAAMLGRLTILRSLGAILYASVAFYPQLIYAWGVELFNRFAASMHQTFVDSYLYAYSNKIHPIHFHLNREIHLSVARAISCALLAVIFYFLPPIFLWLIIGIGAFTLAGWLTLKKSDYLLHE